MRKCILTIAICLLFSALPCKAASPPVAIASSEQTFTLSNGILSAIIDKRSGRLDSLKYNGIETLTNAYWSHSAASPSTTATITIDPKTNGGERGEVAIKGISAGKAMGAGPGGSAIADIEIRFCLARDDSGLYTYSIWEHKADYPATNVGEARFCAKLNDSVFDWMTVDGNRNMKLITAYDWDHGTPMNMKEARLMNTGDYKGQVEHKYDYSANQFQTLTWGWSSTTKHIGIWFINPTIEYLSGGPTKVELSAHRDATFTDSLTAPAVPCLLNYWRGSHYGGSSLVVEQGEHWSKIIGPFLIYCNSGENPDSIWKNALARSPIETKAWPYAWVDSVDYPHREQRATVSGQMNLNDPQAVDQNLPNLLIGLTAPDYTVSSGRAGTSTVTWQNDAKHYEFWLKGDADGRFSIPAVRAGNYTLHAIADGVLGEFARENIKVESGKSLDLGKLEWKPFRYGRQIWDVGIPNRSASEFFKGDDYFHWGMYLQYAKLFPNDVNFTIGKSDFKKDWYFEQVPHDISNDPTGKGKGRATDWTIHFNLPAAVQGQMVLRLAICGIGTKELLVSVNQKPAGTVTDLEYNATINRDGIGGFWTEKDVTFDASLLHAGENQLTLGIPAGGLMNGIMYDYIRLEMKDQQ
jgi:rhamnogalacturonan endolyase